MEIIGYLASILIGISLGLIGGGGSILTIPILVYIFHVNPRLATTYSLFIVGFTAAIGSIKHYQLGNLKFQSAIPFAIPSLVSIIVVRKFLMPIIPEIIFSIGSFSITKDIFIMLIFSVLMMMASYSMIKSKQEIVDESKTNIMKVAFMGSLVGVVTGFLGAGGGFLIIPALIFFTGLTMKEAVGTSLLIIAFNSLFGFLGDVINGVNIDFLFLLSIAFFALIGIFIGTFLSKKIDGSKLKPAFGWFVLVMGIYIIIKEIYLK
jgi:uncharacterized membrane protein YfcA